MASFFGTAFNPFASPVGSKIGKNIILYLTYSCMIALDYDLSLISQHPPRLHNVAPSVLPLYYVILGFHDNYYDVAQLLLKW
jgi:hypothetical protein